FASHFDILCIDNHDIVTTIKIADKIWFFLSHEKFRNFGCLPTECLILKIKDIPISFYFTYFCSWCHYLLSFFAVLVVFAFVVFVSFIVVFFAVAFFVEDFVIACVDSFVVSSFFLP